MDRRTLLKRLGIIGLAIPVAMAVETKLILPETERAEAAKWIKRGVFTIDGTNIERGSLEIVNELPDFRYRYFGDGSGAEPHLGRREVTAQWTHLGKPAYEVGDAVRIHSATGGVVVADLMVVVTRMMTLLSEKGGALTQCIAQGIET